MTDTKYFWGKIKDIGLPIDGHIIFLSQWAWNNYGWYSVDGTKKGDEAARMALLQTIHQNDLFYSYLPFEDFVKDFVKMWESDEYEPAGGFTIELDKVEIIEEVFLGKE